jgi:signal transduction histidine kinase
VDGSPAHARELTVMTASGSVVLRAVAPREVIERPIRDALLPLLFLLALLSVVLAAAGVAQVYFGLRPLRAFRDAVADIRWGRARQVPDDQPSELKPLAQELNAFARDNHAALAAARASAANLAHALKTPVATLALELRDEPERARQVARIDATIRHHLSRARGRVTDRQAHTLVAIAVADLVHTVARLTAERAVQIDIVGNLHVSVAVDQRDFDEIVGNLLDNAVRHTRSQVIIRADCADGFLRLSIEDDGMGIPSTERARAAEPGVRLDERGAGHGFGLAIAGELSELYGGRLTLEQSHSGGLAAAVRLPLWTVSGS